MVQQEDARGAAAAGSRPDPEQQHVCLLWHHPALEPLYAARADAARDAGAAGGVFRAGAAAAPHPGRVRAAEVHPGHPDAARGAVLRPLWADGARGPVPGD